MTDAERGARLIFLNRTCFNGLWRVNRAGKFNVPFGRYTNPKILDADGLRAASAALSKAEIVRADFADVTRDLGAGDFVYFDPPYVPLSKSASFTAYASSGFGPADQERLLVELGRLRESGVMAMLSNADTDATRDMYGDFAIHLVTSARSINSKPSGRGHVGELIVTSWGVPGVDASEAQAPTGTVRATRVSSRA
jgi:DNA adenine methylase